MKIQISNREIPEIFRNRLQKMELDYVGGSLTEYELNDDFVRDLRLYISGANQDNYTTQLIKLIFKADIKNIVKLSEAYPAECLTISLYKNSDNFYKKIESNSNV
jgi:uncharacterized membrane protein